MKIRYTLLAVAFALGAAQAFALTITDLSTFSALSYSTHNAHGNTIRVYKDLAYSTRDDLPTEGAGFTGGGDNGTHRSGTYYDIYIRDSFVNSASALSNMPVFVFLHGGAWCQPYDKDVACTSLLDCIADKGFFVVTMDYQLQENAMDMASYFTATERENATFGHMLKDVDTMLAYLKTELPKIGVPTNKVVIGGESAGGHLALCYAFDETNPIAAMADVGLSPLTHPLHVSCVLSDVGPTDLSEGPNAQGMFDMLKKLMGWLTGTNMNNMDFATAKPIIQKWAPNYLVSPKACSAVFAYGCSDETPTASSTDTMVPVSNFVDLTNRFTNARIPHYAHLYTKTKHGDVAGTGAEWMAEKLAALKTINFDVAVSNVLLKASTDKENPIDYVEGEEIRFDFRMSGIDMEGVEVLPLEIRTNQSLHVIWTRTADDGVTVKGTNTISLTQGCSVTTSLAIPGIVRMQGDLVGSKYKKFAFIDPKDGKTTKYVNFGGGESGAGGGAGVSTEKMQLTTVEPSDFDQFWAEAKAKLATVPMDGAELIEVFPKHSVTNTYSFYAAKIPCFGPRPVTGWFVIPKNAKPGTLGCQANFDGYSTTINKPNPPTYGPGLNLMRFHVNAHGYDMDKDAQYYKDFADYINKTNRTFNGQTYSYGLAPQDYDNPTNTYFYYMALRVVRAFDYMKSRPEWNGKTVIAAGGSQGGLQTMWAGGLVDGITKIQPSITWGCDIGCPFNSKTYPYPSRTWGIPSVPGAFYFDSVLHARRVPRDCIAEITRLGMGDYTCPPRGVLLSYYNMRCKVSAKLVQGSTHGYEPPPPNQVYTISKNAIVNAFSSDEPGFDYTNRVVTVTDAMSGSPVTLIATAPDGTTTTATATADENGEATFNISTAPGVAYTYAVELFGDTIATGGFFTGGWDAGGTWFSASATSGESVVSGGSWNATPEIADGKYSIEGRSSFVLDSATSAASSNSFVLVGFDMEFGEFYDGDSLVGTTDSDGFSGFVAATNISAKTTSWMASGAAGWTVLYGDVVPQTNKMYSVRAEVDFASNPPRIRYEVKESSGAAYSPLFVDADRVARWIDCSPAGSALSSVGFEGEGGVASLGGALGNYNVAEADGVGYASFADALASATNSLVLLTNATWPTNTPVGTVSVNLGGYALQGVTLDGNGKAVVENGFSQIPGEGRVNISLAQAAELGVNTSGKSPAQIAEALAANGENGIPLWKSYVLGLDPTKADSQPKASIVMNGDMVELALVGIDVNASAGATVTYKVYKFADLADLKNATPLEGDHAFDEATAIQRSAVEPKMFYQLKVDVNGY